MTAVEQVIDRVLERLMRRLAMMAVKGPAWAVALYQPPGPERYTLDVDFVAVAIDRNRNAAYIDEHAAFGDLLYASLVPHEFNVQETLAENRLSPMGEDFAAIETEALTELHDRGIDPAHRYVHNRVAAKIDPAALPFPVTEDFFAYVFAGHDDVETTENILFSASPKAIVELERQGLMQI